MLFGQLTDNLHLKELMLLMLQLEHADNQFHSLVHQESAYTNHKNVVLTISISVYVNSYSDAIKVMLYLLQQRAYHRLPQVHY